jgi:hypothetical protein
VYVALPGQNCLNKGSVLYALLLKLDLVYRLWKVQEQSIETETGAMDPDYADHINHLALT